MVVSSMPPIANHGRDEAESAAQRTRSRPTPARPGLGDLAEDSENFELLPALEGLVPKLDDVDASGERRVDEVGEVALTGAGIGAEVELRGGEGHEVSVSGVASRSDRTVVDVAVVGGG